MAYKFDDQDMQDDFEERAGFLEFCGRMKRRDAESQAAKDIREKKNGKTRN